MTEATSCDKHCMDISDGIQAITPDLYLIALMLPLTLYFKR